jgi:hypothetical protein
MAYEGESDYRNDFGEFLRGTLFSHKRRHARCLGSLAGARCYEVVRASTQLVPFPINTDVHVDGTVGFRG